MSDSKNRSDNERYAEGYREGYTGQTDPLRNTVEGVIFGLDEIKEAGRRNGIAMKEREERLAKARPAPAPHQPRAQKQSAPRSSSTSYSSSGAGKPLTAFEIVAGIAVLGSIAAYLFWCFVTFGPGKNPTFGEVILAIPGVIFLFYVGAYIALIVGALAVVVLIIALIFGL